MTIEQKPLFTFLKETFRDDQKAREVIRTLETSLRSVFRTELRRLDDPSHEIRMFRWRNSISDNNGERWATPEYQVPKELAVMYEYGEFNKIVKLVLGSDEFLNMREGEEDVVGETD